MAQEKSAKGTPVQPVITSAKNEKVEKVEPKAEVKPAPVSSVPPPIPTAAVKPAPVAEVKPAVGEAKKVFTDATEGKPENATGTLELTREQKHALFEDVFAAEAGIKKAEEAVKAAAAVRTAKVKALIAGLNGFATWEQLAASDIKPKLGMWRVNGVQLRARMRGDSAYLLRPEDSDVEDI